MNQVYWNGKLRPPTSRILSALNTGLLFGESLFESLPVYGGRPLFWNDHMSRLSEGAKFLGWRLPPGVEFKKALRRMNQGRAGKNYLIRFTLFQELEAYSKPGGRLGLLANGRPLRHDLAQPEPPLLVVGISPWIAPDSKGFPNWFKIPTYILTRSVLREHPEWNEVLRLSPKGYVVDGGYSSPLWFDGKKIWVPPPELGGLKGVTQAKVLGLCRKMGIAAVEKPWTPQAVLRGGELIFTGSGVGIALASRLQGRKLGSKGLARRLWTQYQRWAV